MEGLPQRDRLKDRLTELWNYERYGAPFKKGGRYFFFKNDGLQNQSVLYKQASLADEPEVLLDPNTLSEKGTAALSTLELSEDGKRLVYGVASSGSDWQEFRVRDVDTARDLDDHIQWVKFSGASWTHDSAGFFYSRFPSPNRTKHKAESTAIKRFTTTSSAPSSRRTSSSTSVRTSPSGVSTRPSPTPETMSSSTSATEPTSATASTTSLSATRPSPPSTATS